MARKKPPVLKIIPKLQPWWKGKPAVPTGPVPYRIECGCGHVLEGARQPEYQVLPCPKCGSRIFVLPLSAWPRVAGSRAAATEGGRVRLWNWPAPWKIVLVVGLATMTALILFVGLLHQSEPSPKLATAQPPDPSPRLAAGRTALDQGNFRTALDELDAVRSMQDRLAMSLAQRRELSQLRRQAALLADLLAAPLEELLREADDLGPDEWQLVFRDRYRGKAVLFDALLRRTAAGNVELAYVLRAGTQPARLAIGDLELITRLGKDMHLDRPTRTILGGRLSRIGQEPSGTWVVHFEAKSGVLLTDRASLLISCPSLRDDARDLERVLKRQSAWLANLP
jgi:hypothetical protein